MADPRHSPYALDRREVLTLGVGVFVAASVPWAARAPRRLFRRRIPVMGTIAEVAVVDREPRHARDATEAAFAALRRTDRLMSRFRRDSDVGRANRCAADRAVRVSAETAGVIARSLAWARSTEGRFDPCLGRATALWDVRRRSRPPASDDVHSFANRGLWEALDLDLDHAGGVVRFRDRDVAIDLGGIAKGYGVDQAVAALRAHGIVDAFVNVGGDLYALGSSADGDAWRVGVRDAGEPARITRTLELRDRAVATSGDYQQYFQYDGRRYHHLLDPRTGAPVATARHSVTMEGASCVEADAAATAAFARA